ncbi:hypothetical protein C8R47DRAFT_1063240 [Mycena vitilis]|nr:hypothetical protein C8R47DRAFT_1063240 [Mycena vitilis]
MREDVARRSGLRGRGAVHVTAFPINLISSSTAMSKRKKKTILHEARETPGQRKSEVLEKDRLRVARRRGAVKARRRQWDPPPKPRMDPPGDLEDDYFDSGEDEPVPVETQAKLSEDASLTPAEHFALAVLTDMANTRVIDDNAVESITALTGKYGPPRISPVAYDCPVFVQPYVNSDGVDSVLEMANQLSSDASPSHHSSVSAVNEEAVSIPRGSKSRYLKRLPPYVSPATPLQKKVQRELGVIGPLTDIQQAQIATAELCEMYWGEDPDPPVVIAAPFLSSQRWEHICRWRWHPEYDTDWDLAARRGFAEATLRRRALY